MTFTLLLTTYVHKAEHQNQETEVKSCAFLCHFVMQETYMYYILMTQNYLLML